jgi:hypothetical protein
MENIGLFFMVLLLSCLLLFSFLLLCFIFRHFILEWFGNKITGKYGTYVYSVDQYGWSRYKIKFSKKQKILWLFNVWWLGKFFGKAEDTGWVEERMSPKQLEFWVNSSLKDYESHLTAWGKVGATDMV